MAPHQKVKAGGSGNDEPDESTCTRVDEMNEPSTEARARLDEFGPLSKPAGGPDLSSLKEFGPYKYPDGSTYRGQYRYG